MSGASIVSIVLASMAFFVGAYYFFYYSSAREKREDLAFSLTCFAASAYDIMSAMFYDSASLGEGAFWQKHQMAALSLMGIFILWFISEYTGRKSRRWDYVFTAYWIFEMAMWFVNPWGAMWTHGERAKDVEVLGLSMRYHQIQPGVLAHFGDLVMLMAIIYVFWTLVRYARAGNGQRAVPVLIGFAGLAAAFVNDTATSYGAHDFFYVLEHAYMFFVVCMAYSMLTTQIRTGAALRQSEERYRTFLRDFQGIAFRGKLGFKPTFFHGAVEKITGYSEADFIRENPRWENIIHPEDLARIQDTVEALRTVPQCSVGREYRIIRKDGQERWLYELIHNVLVGGKPAYVQGAIYDITERKRAEEALRENERFLSNIFASIQDGLSILDTDFNIVRANSTMEKWYAHSLPLAGKKCYEAYHGRTRPCDICPSRHAIDTQKAAYGVLPKRGAGSEMVGWLDLFSFPLVDEESGKVIGVIEYVRDITERRQAEEEVHRLAAAVNGAAESIVITDASDRILYVNPSFERHTGYTRAEALGQKPSIVRSGKHDRAFYKQLWDTLLAGRVWRGHFTNRKKDGTLYEEEAVISPVRDESRQIVNFVAVKRDVTQEILLENELRQSQKMEAIGRLAGRVAHDFTNLLVIIQGNAGLVKDRLPHSHEAVEYLESIIDASNRACKLTSQLLAFSHRQPMVLRKVDLGKTILGMQEMLQRTIRSDVHLNIHVANQPCAVRADPDHIEQIVVHMVINSCDAMPEGGAVTIETSAVVLSKKEAIQLRREPKEELRTEGAFGVVSVTDSGCGMTPEVKAHLFEPFFTTKSGAIKGTGLGLSTIYGIVEQHEGFITVYTKPGMGTTFRIYLKLTGKAEQDVAALERPEDAPTGTGTILLADDDLVSRGLMVGTCQSLGYSVLETENIRQTIELAQACERPIDLLMVDFALLKTSQVDAVAEIRKKHPNIKVLPTTGLTRWHLIDAGAAGANDLVLCRPYRKGVVARHIRAALTGGRFEG